ncbi:hypothetical protein EDD85DRAFT_955707 [Armillaria nabsnona]|nr:hypothetical protein EDD85DRAFT_955707 [Armillaria nabsnona]
MLRSCTCRNCGFVNLLPPDGGHQPQPWTLEGLPKFKQPCCATLRESRMLDDNEAALIGADIQKLERLQSFYDAQLQEVRLRYLTVTEALEARRLIRALIPDLPRDILIEIF